MNTLMSQPNHRILIIDDNPAIHDDFRKILGSGGGKKAPLNQAQSPLFWEPTASNGQASFELDSAFQGTEGLEKVEKAIQAGRPYAMAFVDVRMPPGWDGVETIQHIWEVHPELQIVMCTAYADYSWDEITA